MSFIEYELPAGIIKALCDDAALTGLISKHVFDKVPLGFEMPYLTLDITGARDMGLTCNRLMDVAVSIHIWARVDKDPQCYRIAAAVRNALHMKSVTAANSASVCITQANSRFLKDPDEVTRHGIVEFSVKVEEPA